jgi:hypothetical protein
MLKSKLFSFIKNPIIFWLLSFIFFSLITTILFHNRLENISTHYGMPDIDTDGGLWYQWYEIYNAENNHLFYITTLISYPYGFDFTFLPFSNLVYSMQIFFLKHLLGFSWPNLILITNISSLVTYPLSALGASLLGYYLTKNKWASLITGLIFSFSFYHVHMARGQMSINHIEFIPFYFLSLFYFLNKRNVFSLALSALTFAILFTADAYYAFFSGILSVVVILLYNSAPFLQKIKTFLCYYPVLLVVLVLVNFNFFITNYYLFNSTQAIATGRNSIPKNELVSVLYYFVPQPFSLLGTYVPALSYILFIIIPFIAFSGLVFLKKSRLYITLLGCFLTAMVTSAYIQELYWLNELYFRFFGIFRGVARMILPAYLFIGLMVGLVIAEFAKTKQSKKINNTIIHTTYISLIIIIILNSLNVDETWHRKSDFSKDAALYEEIKNNENIKVIATYPMTQGDVVSGCPETYQIKAQIIHNKSYACGASPFQPEAQEHYKKISDINDKETIDYLIEHNIDTISISNKLMKNSESINMRLINDPKVEFVGRYTAEPDEGYISTTDRARDISVYQLAEVVESNKNPTPLFYSTNENVEIIYEKISSEKYVLSLKNLDKNSDIIFNFPFSEKFKMYVGDLSEDNDISFNFKNDKLYNDHSRHSEYQNKWAVDPENIKKLFPDSYSENPDKSINFKATIFFAPQSIYSLGSVISKSTFIILTLFLIMRIAYGKFKK